MLFAKKKNSPMIIAIMQPYLFPYIGYYQLIHAADKFVFYDDVNFIKQGWLNRNRILQTDLPVFFTLPIKNVSSYSKICDTQIDDKSFPLWKSKFLKTLQYNYSKAPYYKMAFGLIESVLANDSLMFNDFAKKSVVTILDYIGINTSIIKSSSIYNNQILSAQERVMDICKKENAEHYINVSGGVALYNAADFENEGIKLSFIKSKVPVYKQFNDTFHSGLSIIDVLMFCSREQIVNMMDNYTLFKNTEA
jgi:WbqC-like protein family